MKILSIANMEIWPWGENKGIPSIFASQKGFADRGHTVYFLCPYLEGKAKSEKYCGINIRRFNFPFNREKVVYIQSGIGTNRLKASLLSNFHWLFFQIFAFYRGMQVSYKLKPDLIYAHSFTSAFPAFFVSIFFRTKLVIRVYGTRQLYWWWPNWGYRIKEFRDYLAFKIPADYFVITNDGTQGDRLAKKLGVRDEKIKCWRNGIDKEMFELDPKAKDEICKQLNIDPGLKIIVSTCRLRPDYAVDSVLAALVDVFKKHPKCVCLVAGEGTEKKKLKDFAEDNNIASKVIFLGIVDHNMIKKMLNAADIFVFLSKLHNCTNTMWEAMTCGKCIVTTETESIKEVLTQQEDVLLVPKGDINAASDALNTLLDNDDLVKKLGEKARKTSEQVMETWPQRIEKEAKLLEALVKK